MFAIKAKDYFLHCIIFTIAFTIITEYCMFWSFHFALISCTCHLRRLILIHRSSGSTSSSPDYGASSLQKPLNPVSSSFCHDPRPYIMTLDEDWNVAGPASWELCFLTRQERFIQTVAEISSRENPLRTVCVSLVDDIMFTTASAWQHCLAG